MGIKLTVCCLLSAVCFFTGCAVDNEYIAKLPLFEAKSDKIPGLDPPYHRAKLIREKGEKGKTAPEEQKEILAAQLMLEYQNSPDPNMRRAAVDALAKINCSSQKEYLLAVLKDEDAFIRLSAIEALAPKKGYETELIETFIDRMQHDTDKDVRIAAIRQLKPSFLYIDLKGVHTNRLVSALGDQLSDKVPAVRYEAMLALGKITGKDYGTDINRWAQYIRYTRGEEADLPQPRSFAEKIPRIDLPMFK